MRKNRSTFYLSDTRENIIIFYTKLGAKRKEGDKLRIFIYARKSVFTGKGESIENQIELCRQHMRSLCKDDYERAEIVEYCDTGYYGKNIDRPYFQKMMTDLRSKKPDYLVVYRLDRLSRSVADFATLLNELMDRGISLVCVREGFNTASPFGKTFLYLVAIFAEMERDTIAERVRDNMMLLARTGRWLGGPPPTGFSTEKVADVIIDGKTKTSSKLIVEPLEIKTVRLIFSQFAESQSLAGVYKYLLRNGIKSRDGKSFSHLGIKGILQNPVYCAADLDALEYFRSCGSDVCFDESSCNSKLGLIAYNKRDYKQKGSPRLGKDQWIIAIGKHPAIIPGKQWVAIQRAFEKGDSDGERPPKQRNDYSLLSGLLVCEKCGSRMFSKPRSGKTRTDKTQYDYICGLKMSGGTVMCDCQNLPGQLTDDAVCRELSRYTEEGSLLFEHLERMRQNLAQQVSESPLAEIDKQIKKADEELNNLVAAIAQGVDSAMLEKINERASRLKEEIDYFTEKRRRYENIMDKVDEKELELDLIVHSLATLKNRFEELTLSEKRTILRMLIKKIVWNGEKLHIFPNGE